ncbi:MAG: hypothetical protein LBV50_08020 [Novosphingobium sp.]|jgi:hypothetical protein|nr:hypothetical protein [Novosphingobium sp.]
MPHTDTIKRRISPRRRNAEAMTLTADMPLRRKQLLVARILRNTIVPQMLWLHAGAGRIGILGANRRIQGISLRLADHEESDLHCAGPDSGNWRKTAEIVHEHVRGFLARKTDISRSFEQVDADFPAEDGLPAGIVVSPRYADMQRGRHAPAVAVTEAPPPARKADCGSDAQTAQSPTILHELFGDKILLIWMPPNPDQEGLAVEIGKDTMTTSSFQLRMLGRLLQDRL